jgi:hypothetical protein
MVKIACFKHEITGFSSIRGLEFSKNVPPPLRTVRGVFSSVAMSHNSLNNSCFLK